jgi:putative ABC transport system permease protein
VVAAAAASTGAWLIATRLLQIPYGPDPLLWIQGALSGALLVCVAGYLSTRSALSQPPMLVLRNG